jgi:hypothetical protein
MEIMGYYNGHNLPYYGKVELHENGWIVTPPADHRLSDALVFLVVGQTLVKTIECARQPNASGETLN